MVICAPARSSRSFSEGVPGACSDTMSRNPKGFHPALPSRQLPHPRFAQVIVCRSMIITSADELRVG